MKEAIQKAIEGGWEMKPVSYVEGRGAFWNQSGKGVTDLIIWQQTTSDPLFWQALGKAMGWERKKMFAVMGESGGYEADDYFITWVEGDDNFEEEYYDSQDLTRYHWHRFTDHLAEGKDAESFFKELIK